MGEGLSGLEGIAGECGEGEEQRSSAEGGQGVQTPNHWAGIAPMVREPVQQHCPPALRNLANKGVYPDRITLHEVATTFHGTFRPDCVATLKQ